MQRDTLCLVDRQLCPVLPAIVSKRFHRRICRPQNFASALEIDDKRLAINSPPAHSQLRFLDAFRKFREATVSFTSVCPSVRMEQLGSHWMDFDET